MLATDTLFSLPRVCFGGQQISREIQVSKGRNRTFFAKIDQIRKKKKTLQISSASRYKNEVRVGCIWSCGRSPIPHFDVLCDLLLNRRTATSNLFVLFNKEVKKSTMTLFMSLSSNRS